MNNQLQRNLYNRITIIGGSAGSIEPLISIIKGTNKCTDPIGIVIHFLKDRETLLNELLARYTQKKVEFIENDTIFHRNTIYIARPNYHVILVNGRVKLNQNEPFNYSRPSIDILMKSFSDYYKDKMTCVLLCGYGEDGTISLSDQKTNGTKILIQKPLECVANSIPINAVKTGAFTKVLTLADLIEELKVDFVEILNNSPFDLFNIDYIEKRISDNSIFSSFVENEYTAIVEKMHDNLLARTDSEDELRDILFLRLSTLIQTHVTLKLCILVRRDTVLSAINKVVDLFDDKIEKIHVYVLTSELASSANEYFKGNEKVIIKKIDIKKFRIKKDSFHIVYSDLFISDFKKEYSNIIIKNYCNLLRTGGILFTDDYIDSEILIEKNKYLYIKRGIN